MKIQCNKIYRIIKHCLEKKICSFECLLEKDEKSVMLVSILRIFICDFKKKISNKIIG